MFPTSRKKVETKTSLLMEDYRLSLFFFLLLYFCIFFFLYSEYASENMIDLLII